MEHTTDMRAQPGSSLPSSNGKRAFNLLPAGILTAAFLIFTSLPSFYSSAGILATPLAVLLTIAACILVFASGFALLTLVGNRVPASLSPGIVILGSAASGWLLFWAWFAHPHAGMVASLTMSAAAMLVLGSKPVAAAWKRISLPATVSVIVCIGYISLAGDRGGLEEGNRLVGGRYWAIMDNAIPQIFADRLINNKVGLKPFLLGDWHSSDRPPLQTGMMLAAYPFVKQAGAALAGLVLSIVINIFWIWGLWGFLRAVGLTERKILQVIISLSLVGAVFVNSVYAWPKMLAAALSFTAGAVLLAQTGSQRIRTLMIGGAVALSLLAHGAALFALLGLAPLYWPRRKEWPLRDLAIAVTVAAFLYFPWSAYQKFYDPPGDRMIKWHLAGIIPLEEKKPALHAMAEVYRQAGWRGVVENKIHNLRMLLGDATDWNGTYAAGYAHPGWNYTLDGQLREFFILRLGPAPMLLLLGLPLLCFRKIRQAMCFQPLFRVLLVTSLFLVLFEFGSTSSSSPWLFHAPYTALLLWCGLCALAISELGEKWFLAFLAFHLISFVALWDYTVMAWSAGPPPAEAGHPDLVATLIAAFSFLTLLAMYLRPKRWASEAA